MKHKYKHKIYTLYPTIREPITRPRIPTVYTGKGKWRRISRPCLFAVNSCLSYLIVNFGKSRKLRIRAPCHASFGNSISFGSFLSLHLIMGIKNRERERKKRTAKIEGHKATGKCVPHSHTERENSWVSAECRVEI